MPGPLGGLRVLDFGQYVAGPLTAVLLGGQGADVIHVDPPGGPCLAGVADAFFNRGKRRVTLDLKQPGDLAAGWYAPSARRRPGRDAGAPEGTTKGTTCDAARRTS